MSSETRILACCPLILQTIQIFLHTRLPACAQLTTWDNCLNFGACILYSSSHFQILYCAHAGVLVCRIWVACSTNGQQQLKQPRTWCVLKASRPIFLEVLMSRGNCLFTYGNFEMFNPVELFLCENVVIIVS